jgi:periplasmic protein TonB
MFENLVESTSHKDDFARKGSFILGTLAIYAVLGITFFVVGIYWYDAHLENQNLELTTLVTPVPQEDTPTPQEAPKQTKASEDREVSTVKQITSERPENVTQPAKSVASNSPPIKGAVLGNQDKYVASAPSLFGEGTGGTGSAPAPPPPSGGDEPPPPAPPKPSPTPKPTPHPPVSGGVLNGKALSLARPNYPPLARAAHASGTVVVQVTIDETGKVVSAHAISGHPLLQAAAVEAAYRTRFSPTQLSGQPVKVTGTINYIFQP